MAESISIVFWTILMVAPISYLFVKKKLITRGAAVSIIAMAIWLVLLIQPTAIVLPFIFLVLGSLASKLNKNVIYSEEKEGRTVLQVFANGGCAMIVAIPFHYTYDDRYLIIYSIIFASALSDTLSSEIGRYFKGKTIDLRTFQLVSPGISGGVSIKGTFAGLLGSFIMSLVAALVFDFEREMILCIALMGFLGMLVDSIIGAFAQAKYMIHGIPSEEGRKDQLIYGFHWIDNNMVNFLSIATISIAAYLFL